MRVPRTDSEVFGEQCRQHQMRQGSRVAADQAVDITAFEFGIIESRLGRLAHQIERRAVRQFAEPSQPDTRDPTHFNELISRAVFRNTSAAR